MAKAKANAGPLESVLGISAAQAKETLATLTARELQVAELMATGAKNADIAAQIGIRVKTLDIHRAKLKTKLKARSSVDVARVVFAAKLGEHVN